MQATTAQLYPGLDTFEFDQGHMTKNQPITVFILLGESLAIYIIYLVVPEHFFYSAYMPPPPPLRI